MNRPDIDGGENLRTAGFSFRVLARDGHARRSVLVTPHAEVDLPTFMPVGTQGAVKTLSPHEVASTGAQIVLGNTYHLWLRPGPEAVAEFGGLHAFSHWPRAMLTDSGGFQAFSLGNREQPRTGRAVSLEDDAGGSDDPDENASSARRTATATRTLSSITEEGVDFRSHLDGTKLHLSPEEAVRIQGLLGADIQMQLDVCPPGESPREAVEEAVRMTTRWGRRALACTRPQGQALFGIVQGGTFADLRRAHADELGALPFDGLALGGFSVGEPIPKMYETLAEVAPYLDRARPRYLMGVGTPADLLEGIEHGVDMFDCVLPTRNARNGQALTRFGKLVIKQARYRQDALPIDPECTCYACREGFSRGYLRHLYLVGEILALRLMSLHNLHFYGELMAGAREAIALGTFKEFKRVSLERMRSGS